MVLYEYVNRYRGDWEGYDAGAEAGGPTYERISSRDPLRPLDWLDKLGNVLDRNAQCIADLYSTAPRQEAGTLPIADRWVTDLKRSRKFAHTARSINKGIDVHGPIVEYSDMPCQPQKVGGIIPTPEMMCHKWRMIHYTTPGARLRALRKERKLIQAVVADAVGASRQHLTGVENDKNPPGRDLLVALAKFYGVSETYILHGGDLSAYPPETPQFINDPDELALIAFWRELSRDQRRLFLKMVRG